jgi:regulator of sigma E protease
MLADSFWLLNLGFWAAAIKAILGFSLVIFVHELGHFVVARLCGVKCEKFYVGFDVPLRLGPLRLPRTLFRKQWGETEYGIGIIPLGGYVKMLGQDDNPANAAREAERVRIPAKTAELAEGLTDVQETEPEKVLDPRSYPAQPVWQRMAIISAGVTMNLIFAVIFGMIAYGMGVSYTPAQVGSTTPGFSAWEQGLKPGDRILQIGRNNKRTEHLRFDKDMRVHIVMAGPNQQLPMYVRRFASGQSEWVTLETSPNLAALGDWPAVGLTPMESLIVSEPVREIRGLARAETQPALQPGDRIVAVEGETLDEGDYPKLAKVLARQVDQDLALTVVRPGEQRGQSDQRLSVLLPARPVRGVGLGMKIGPIVSIQKGSPAARAGLQIGDVITEVDGQRVIEPMKLAEKLRQLAGSPIEFVVRRKDQSQPVRVTVTPEPPEQFQQRFSGWSPVGAFAVGIAYQVDNEVAWVEPGGPADRAGLKVGDRLEKADFLLNKVPEENRPDLKIEELAVDLADNPNAWPAAWDEFQLLPEGIQVRLHYVRDGKPNSAVMPVEVEQGSFSPQRWLLLADVQENHQAQSWSEAFQLGVRETREGIWQVGVTLRKLILGEVAITKLGGPATILAVAGIEASHSVSRLLVFLTLLSANLAVLNILPIPVLDGGHLMFLIYEVISGKPVNERVALGLTMLGFSLLLGLMVFVLGMDIYRLAGIGG